MESESTFGPGQSLRMSDLEEGSLRENQPTAIARPHRLEPLQQAPSNPRRKRKTKKIKKDQQLTSTMTSDTNEDDLMDEAYLNQLRSRLDPTFHSQPLPDLATTSISPVQDDEEASLLNNDLESTIPAESSAIGTDTAEVGGKKQRKKSKKRKVKKRDPEEEEEAEGELSMEGEAAGSNHPSECHVAGSIGRTRDLPALPDELQQQTVATGEEQDQHAMGTGEVFRHELSCPNDPPFLVAEEDIREGPFHPPNPLSVPSSAAAPQQALNGTTAVMFQQQLDGGGFVKLRSGGRGGVGVVGDLNRLGTATVNGVRSAYSSGLISGADFALTCHKLVRGLSVASHGLLAGLSLWDCVVSNVISRQPGGHVNLLLHYHPFPLALHSIYLVLLLITITTLLLRFDVGNVTKMCIEEFCLSPSDVVLCGSLLLLVLAFLVTASVTFLDEQLVLFTTQPSLWSEIVTNSTTASTMALSTVTIGDAPYFVIAMQTDRTTAWLAITIIRAVCSCISWLLVVWITKRDRTEDLLCKLSADSCQQQEAPES